MWGVHCYGMSKNSSLSQDEYTKRVFRVSEHLEHSFCDIWFSMAYWSDMYTRKYKTLKLHADTSVNLDSYPRYISHMVPTPFIVSPIYRLPSL